MLKIVKYLKHLTHPKSKTSASNKKNNQGITRLVEPSSNCIVGWISPYPKYNEGK